MYFRIVLLDGFVDIHNYVTKMYEKLLLGVAITVVRLLLALEG